MKEMVPLRGSWSPIKPYKRIFRGTEMWRNATSNSETNYRVSFIVTSNSGVNYRVRILRGKIFMKIKCFMLLTVNWNTLNEIWLFVCQQNLLTFTFDNLSDWFFTDKQYVINVHTGDVSGAGTDANVFLTIFGDKGDSGERKLHKSDTYSDKFERNHVSTFSMKCFLNQNCPGVFQRSCRSHSINKFSLMAAMWKH